MHCFSASDFLPKIMKGQIKSQTCENSGLGVIDEKAAWELHKTALGISECKRAAKLKLWAQTVHFFFLFGRQTVRWWSKQFQTALPTQVIIFSAWSVYNIWQSAVPCCYLFLLDLCVLTVFERRTLCEVSGEDYMWQIWRGNQEKTNRQLNAWEMSQRSDRRR